MRYFIIGLVLFMACVLGLVAYATFRLTEPKPKVIKVIANGQKYYPTPYVPEKQLPEWLKDKAGYTFIERVTE